MKRPLVGAAVLADAMFALSLGADAWQTVTVFVAIVAAVVLGVIAWNERIEIKRERDHVAELSAWIHAHHAPTSFRPYDGDGDQR